IVRDAAGSPSPNVRVQVAAIPTGHASGAPIADLTTNAAGAFDLTFAPAEKGWKDASALPQIQAEALSPDRRVIGRSAVETLHELQFTTRLDVVLDVAATGSGDGAFVVHGTITFEGAAPAGEVTVVAFDRDLRTRQKLGQMTTAREYTITYSPETSKAAEIGSADVFVEVRDRDDVVLATSGTVFNAPADLTLDV